MIGPSWQETFVALHGAETLEELWMVLLLPHSMRSASGWDEPYILFRKFHAEDPDDAAATALLLCTDRRWRKAAHGLIHELAGSELLDSSGLDQLADWFMAHGLEVSVPRRLFDGQPVILTPSSPDDTVVEIARPVSPRPDRHDRAMVGVRRSVWPPLRRWAAARWVARRPARWRDVIEGAFDWPRFPRSRTIWASTPPGNARPPTRPRRSGHGPASRYR